MEAQETNDTRTHAHKPLLTHTPPPCELTPSGDIFELPRTDSSTTPLPPSLVHHHAHAHTPGHIPSLLLRHLIELPITVSSFVALSFGTDPSLPICLLLRRHNHACTHKKYFDRCPCPSVFFCEQWTNVLSFVSWLCSQLPSPFPSFLFLAHNHARARTHSNSHESAPDNPPSCDAVGLRLFVMIFTSLTLTPPSLPALAHYHPPQNKPVSVPPSPSSTQSFQSSLEHLRIIASS